MASSQLLSFRMNRLRSLPPVSRLTWMSARSSRLQCSRSSFPYNTLFDDVLHLDFEASRD